MIMNIQWYNTFYAWFLGKGNLSLARTPFLVVGRSFSYLYNGFFSVFFIAFGSHLLTSTLEAGNKSSTHLKETVSKSVPSIGGGQSTPHWLLTNSKTPADVTGSSASRGEVLTQFSDSAQQSTGRKTAVDEKSYSESLSPSFSQSLESLAQRGEHSSKLSFHRCIPQEREGFSMFRIFCGILRHALMKRCLRLL